MSLFQNRALVILFCTLFLDTISFSIVIPVIPSLLTDPHSPNFFLHGYSESEQFFSAGLIVAIYGIMQFFAAPILGELSDLFGRKRLLMLGILTLALSQFFFGMGIVTASLLLLFLSRAVAGMAAANISIAQAVIADVTAPQDRAKNFGLIGAAFGIGFIIGPLISGLITAKTGDPANAFWLATTLGFLNAFFVYRFLPETRQKGSRNKKFSFLLGIQNIQTAIQKKETRAVYAISFFFFSGFTFFVSFISILLQKNYGFSEENIGTYFAVVGVTLFITQAVILRFLVRRFREHTLLPITIFLTAIATIVTPFAPSALVIYLLVPFFAIPQGITMAILPALISNSVSQDSQGAALGVNASVMALSQGLIPLIAGSIAALSSLTAVFAIGGMVMFVAWMILFFSRNT